MTTTVIPAARADLDQTLAVLRAHADEWARLPLAEKIALFEQMHANVTSQARTWAEGAARAKGLPPDSPYVGEEWMSGPWAMLHALNRTLETLRAIARTGYPPLDPRRVRARHNGQVVVRVFPETLHDRLLLNGVRADVWMQTGVTAANLRETMGVQYRQAVQPGGVALVLGAGNITSIAPLDVLHKLVAAQQVCLLKPNPIADYMTPVLRVVLAPLIERGFVQIVEGGANVGAYLCQHPAVDAIHITGSARTHDAIVYGAGVDGLVRKAQNRPLLRKPITSELGGVGPTIIVPGPWSADDIGFQVEHVLTHKLHNAGFNCVAGQVLVLPRQWAHTAAFRVVLRDQLRRLPARPTYYPGARDRQRDLAAAHGRAELFDAHDGINAPRTLLPDLDWRDADQPCFTDEAFSGVLGEVLLPGDDAASFLAHAVAFCNERLSGTLSANIIVHPATMRALGPALESALAGLRYGCIGVNIWAGGAFLLSQATWGAFPGHTRDDIQSGVGVVHNARLFERPQKTVIYGPFTPFPRSFRERTWTLLPRPPWFVTNERAHRLGELLTRYEARPSLLKLPRIFAEALLRRE